MKRKIRRLNGDWIEYDPEWEELKRFLKAGFGIIAWFALVCIGLCLFCSCSTKKVSTVERVTDTLMIYKSDTIRLTSHSTLHDTCYVEKLQNNTIVLNEKGDTVKQVVYIHDKDYRSKSASDSTDYYRSKADSLQSVKENVKELVKEKSLPWYQRLWLDCFPYVLIAIVFFFIVIMSCIYKVKKGRS